MIRLGWRGVLLLPYSKYSSGRKEEIWPRKAVPKAKSSLEAYSIAASGLGAHLRLLVIEPLLGKSLSPRDAWQV